MIEVAAGVLHDSAGRVLLMQRLPGKDLAGLWEFPGGKLEPGESVQQALVRELREELAVEVCASTPLISLPWRYPAKTVRLHALRVTDWRGTPDPREGHPLRWTRVEDMDVAAMPAADLPIVTALRLPACYVICEGKAGPHAGPGSYAGFPGPRGPAPEPATTGPPALSRALMQLRMPGASRDAVRAQACGLLRADPTARGRLLVNHDIELARELGIGVHLKSAQLGECGERPLPRESWVGASCHGPADLERAAAVGADFATLSPVCATASHPGAEPLGWAVFARWVADARVPVYALGGVRPEDLQRAHAAGAQGVAGIRAFSGHAPAHGRPQG